MCGIAGILNADLDVGEIQAALARMQRAMLHRGPDQGGSLVFPETRSGLCARRLSIVDLEHGSQPVANEDETVFAVLNGEIYNHNAIRERLLGLGHRFRGRSDTEALLHLYEQDGIECLDELRGMFAAAIYEPRRGRLLLARDGAGMKPLYFARTPQAFLFASEASALFATGLIRPEPNLEALNVYLEVGFVPAPLSTFKGVRKLRAGQYLTLDSSGERSADYWQFQYRPADPARGGEDYAAELDTLLEGAVRSHLAADVPVGAFLSGGWDSSLAATYAARAVGRKLKTFSIVFPDDSGADESRFSRRMAEYLGTDHHEIEYRDSLLPPLLPKVARHLEEPSSNVPAGVMLVLASLAARHVKTTLSGEGADELFGGYEHFRIGYPYTLRRFVPQAPARLAAGWCGPGRLRRGFRILGAPDDRTADCEWRRPFTREDRHRLLCPEYRGAAVDVQAALISPHGMNSCAGTLERRLAFEFTGRLANSILFEADKMSMAHSLEVRMPFLDRSVIDFALRLPSRLKVHRGREKVILSILARRHLPPEIAARRKQGLAYPVGAWTRPPLNRYARELLLDSEGPLDRSYLLQNLPLWLNGQVRAEPQIRCLAMLQLWWNEFIGRGALALSRTTGQA